MKNIIIFNSSVLSLFLGSLNYAATPQVLEKTAIQIFKMQSFKKPINGTVKNFKETISNTEIKLAVWVYAKIGH